ncbi:MAG: serine/threonine-protein kinase [Myxococcota bacterium]
MGRHLSDQLELLRPFRPGGRESTWLAFNHALHNEVAVRFLRSSATLVFRRARELAEVESANIVALHQVGQTREGAPYLEMELLEGLDLREHLREGPLAMADVATVVKHIGQALAVLHERGWVHGQLTPASIFVSEFDDEPLVRLIDFGLDRPPRDASLYAPPELVIDGAEASPATDRWGLAAIAFVALTGRPPFGHDVEQLGVGMATGQIRWPASEALDPWFRTALARDPASRPPTTAELVDDFLRCTREVGLSIV